MSVENGSSVDRRLSAPFVLLMLCLLALLVSLIGLYRTSSITQTRMADLQVSWQAIMEGEIDGTELLATDRLMQSVVRPVPAVRSAAGWSLGMAALSLVFIAWLVSVIRSSSRTRQSMTDQQGRNSQAAVDKLLDEIAPLASGDLGVKATSSEGAAGALADGFNYAIGELRRLVGSQLSTSRTIADSVGQSQALADNIEQHCTRQSDRLHQSSNLLLCLSNTTGDLSASAAESTVTTKLIVDRVVAVSKALKFSLQHVQEARDESGNTTRLLQSLVAYVKAIDEGNASVKDIARRTELLALNTTIRVSASAGQSHAGDNSSSDIGRLTEDVATLAETLGQATGDIGSLANASAADTAEALMALQRITQTLDDHIGQLQSAEILLDEIRVNATATNTQTMSMAENTAMNASVIRDLSENMDLINQITQQTVQNVSDHVESLESVKKLATDLRQSVSDFTLSDDAEASAIEDGTVSGARRAAERAVFNG